VEPGPSCGGRGPVPPDRPALGLVWVHVDAVREREWEKGAQARAHLGTRQASWERGARVETTVMWQTETAQIQCCWGRVNGATDKRTRKKAAARGPKHTQLLQHVHRKEADHPRAQEEDRAHHHADLSSLSALAPDGCHRRLAALDAALLAPPTLGHLVPAPESRSTPREQGHDRQRSNERRRPTDWLPG
jgi:hypothetical protein